MIFGLILGGVFVSICIICYVGVTILCSRYKKFYSTSEGEELKKLLELQKETGAIRYQLSIEHEKLKNEIIRYLFDEKFNDYAELESLIYTYHVQTHALSLLARELEEYQVQIQLFVQQLPKKYRGILDYNYEEA